MKKSIFCFLFIVLGVLLFVGCTNVTGTDMEETSASRAAISPLATKIVEATQELIKKYPTNAERFFDYADGIEYGSESYQYSQDDYHGTLKSYKYNLMQSPYIIDDYIYFRITIYYSGTVYKTESKIVEATQEVIKKYPPNASTVAFGNYTKGIENGSEKYQYSQDGFAGTLNSYKYNYVQSPYIIGDYIYFRITIYYRGTVYKDKI